MLKKLLLKAVMFGFVMFGLSTYAGYLMTGRLPPFIDKFREFLPTSASRVAGQPSWNNLDALSHKATAQPKNYEVMQSGKTLIYKWQDASGHWQYGERAPSNGAATKIEVAAGSAISSSSNSAPEHSTQEPTSGTADHPEMMNPYSPEGVKQLIEKAHAVQNMMNQHNDQLGKE